MICNDAQPHKAQAKKQEIFGSQRLHTFDWGCTGAGQRSEVRGGQDEVQEMYEVGD